MAATAAAWATSTACTTASLPAFGDDATEAAAEAAPAAELATLAAATPLCPTTNNVGST